MLKGRSKLTLAIAQETIDFQRDDFGKQIEAIIKDIFDYIDNNKGVDKVEIQQQTEFPDRLNKLILARLGLNVDIIVNNESIGMTLPFYMNKNHVLLHPLVRNEFTIDEQDKFIRQNANKKGYVDLKNAKVSGVFSDYPHTVWIDVVGYKQHTNMTPKEITAIVLHELGHIFTTLEFSNRLESTNQVLANIADIIRNKGDSSKLTYYYKELERNMDEKDLAKELSDEKNQYVLGIKLFEKYVKFVKTQMPVENYNNSASEQLADSFAARFGYGRELVSSLEKLLPIIGDDDQSRFFRIMCNIGDIIHLVAIGAAFIGLLLTITIFASAFAAFICSYVLFLNLIVLPLFGANFKPYQYDVLKDRYKRVRSQYITMLAKLKLTPAEMKPIVADVEYMDKIINDTVKYTRPLEAIANYIFSFNSRVKEDIAIQQLLEELGSNDLFLRSAQLKTLDLT